MTIKVAQWGSGNVGRLSAQTVVDRPDMELVALHVTNPAKVGRDIGELIGRGDLGIAATGTVEELVESEAEVVLHMPLPSLVYGDDLDADVANFETLLAAGKHVVTTVGYMYPRAHGQSLVDRLAGAATNGGVTFHGTGANPGWFGDLLPLLLSGLSLRVDRIDVQEISCFVGYPSPEIMFEMMNFGRTPAEFEERSQRHRHWLDGLFTEAVMMVADGLGVETTGTTSDQELWIATEDLDTAAGTVAAGTVAGQRYRWAALVDGEPLVTQETVWRMHDLAAPDWPYGDWSLEVVGRPTMRISLPHSWNHNVLGSTAAHAINAVPYLVEAEPGIRTFLDLPMIAGRGAHFPR